MTAKGGSTVKAVWQAFDRARIESVVIEAYVELGGVIPEGVLPFGDWGWSEPVAEQAEVAA